MAEFIPCRRIRLPAAFTSLAGRAATRKKREELKRITGLLGYFPECVWLERCAGLVARSSRRSLLHFIYPENSYFFTAGYRRPGGSKIVATYHQPVPQSREFILKTDSIRKLDAVILLSDTQREFFEPLVGSDRVFVVPHGIDLEFFTSISPPERAEQKIISVGTWLRDFPTLVGAMRILSARAPGIRCDVVANDTNRRLFDGLNNVQFHSGVTDQRLLELYQGASAAVLSLAGAAANNALLEAMACGLPIIATDLPAIREYTTSKGTRYVPLSDPILLAESIIDALSKDRETRARMGKENRSHAMRYAWPEIAQQTMRVYNSLN